MRKQQTARDISEAIISLLKGYLLDEDIIVSNKYRTDVEDAVREQLRIGKAFEANLIIDPVGRYIKSLIYELVS